MKNLSLMFIVVLLFSMSGILFSEDYEGTKTNVAYVIPDEGIPYYASSSLGPDIGYEAYIDDDLREKVRTKYIFDLSGIPVNATINSVTLYYTISNTETSNSYEFRVAEIENYTNAEDIWDDIGSATPLFSDIVYGYNDVLCSCAIGWWVNGSNKINSPLSKSRSTNHWLKRHVIFPYRNFCALTFIIDLDKFFKILKESGPP